MRRTEALEGERIAIFLNILHRWESAELNHGEAAELLGVSERTFRRWRDRRPSSAWGAIHASRGAAPRGPSRAIPARSNCDPRHIMRSK